jgi:hypothetical protein
MMKKSLLLILCLFSCGASAEVYKCIQDGKTTISTLPCPPGATSTAVPVEATPNSAMTPEQEVANMKQKADAMERERLNRSAERATANAPAPVVEDEATEAVNAHGRLNAARRKREEANKPPPTPPTPLPAPAPKSGASGASSTGSASGAPKYIEI